MLKGKTVLLGVTGGIAAYKAADLCSGLVKAGCTVNTVMTRHATELISPVVFDNLAGTRTATDLFDRDHAYQVEHIALSDAADVVVIAPATANIIAKLANGIADDMLTTTVLACNCPKILAPAMNTKMYQNPVTQENLAKLVRFGWHIVEPASGRLACGTTGEGKLAPVTEIFEAIERQISEEKDLKGLRILITAGPTREALDPVRFLTNRSSGKMGYAIAKAAANRGADVTLVSGPVALEKPYGVKVIAVESAQEMFEAVTEQSEHADWIIKAAAVADYRPSRVSDQKIKKKEGGLTIPLTRTQDILGWIGAHKKEGQLLCGFSMETEHMLAHAREKLAGKNLDMIAANNVKEEGAGFAVETNRLTLLTAENEQVLPLLSKEEAANRLLDALLAYKK